MPLQRVQHWAERSFHDFLAGRKSTPFAWGANDCALFAADAVQAVTGVDIADDFRGKYATEAEAWALVRSVTGGEGVRAAADWCAAKHGLIAREVALTAQRGELVLIVDGDREIAGVVDLTGRFAVAPGDEGLRRFPLRAVVKAWRYE